MDTDPDVVIYTDGACKGNPGPGGWGVWLPVAIFTFLLRNHLLRGMSFGAIRK